MPDEKVVEKYIQIGDGPAADPALIDKRIKLFIRIISALDGGRPSLETGVALATLKLSLIHI